MELNKIQSSGSWGKATDDLNQNFSKVNNAVEQVKNATTRNKGYFSSDTELKSAFPSANVGDIAYVGNSYPYAIWKWNGNAWANSGSTGGEESVNLGDYYTKEETNEKLAETDEKLSELDSVVSANKSATNKAISELSGVVSKNKEEADAKLSELGPEIEDYKFTMKWENESIILLETILKNAVYVTDQSANISVLIETLYESRGQIYIIPPTIVIEGSYATITTSTTGATIHYTVDGSVPTSESDIYTEPVLLRESCTVKAIVIKKGLSSSVVSVIYEKPLPQVITFADSTVKSLCITNFDTNKDGEIDYEEAAAVTDLASIFRANTSIVSFTELSHFTGLTSLGYRAFYGCTALTEVVIPESVTSIGNEVFYNDAALVSVNLNNNIKSIGDHAFRNCTMVNISKLPNNLESVGSNCFNACSSMAGLTELPASLKSIGYGAFSNIKIPKLKILSDTPPTLTTSVNNIFSNNTVFYVKDVDAYLADSNWAQASSRIKNINEWTE